MDIKEKLKALTEHVFICSDTDVTEESAVFILSGVAEIERLEARVEELEDSVCRIVNQVKRDGYLSKEVHDIAAEVIKMSDFIVTDIIESEITVDAGDRGWNPDTTRLMHLLQFDDITGCEKECKDEGGNPKRYKVQIQINLKEIDL